MIEVAFAALTPVRWQDATIVARQPQTPNITSFLLRPVTPLQWYAGQHVDIRLTAADGYRAVRSYSIASAPNDSGVIELAIERLADGEVSPFFHDIALVGDVIEMKGPLGGHFVWRPVDHGPVLLVSPVRPRATFGDDPPSRGHARCAPVPPASLSPGHLPTFSTETSSKRSRDATTASASRWLSRANRPRGSQTTAVGSTPPWCVMF